MDLRLPNTWWHTNHLQCSNYPELPTKKQVIYGLFRAAYPHGAFVDDNLKLVELRDKDTVWRRLDDEMHNALDDLPDLIRAMMAELPRLRDNRDAQNMLCRCYSSLLSEARQALFVSQNGRYFEFKSMEELVVRYKRAGAEAWTSEDRDAETGVPPVAGWAFAREHLELPQGSQARHLQHQLKMLDAQE